MIDLNKVMEQFEIEAKLVPYGNGHINDTYCIEASKCI